ncbi:YheC/YheD family protein [Cohnella sp. CFH 77786]|uniref:YheC/YheD family protein n=1 Tax=Cohnella sp. CFH 77786 TaxID=2662265 RepID=UPI001C60DB46|nr:YheC/YheD family protein [Cohnella sp. CFH 77786]MBW5447507.1 YheC/YheD family protein [Cohnella sp. CFH 77786]
MAKPSRNAGNKWTRHVVLWKYSKLTGHVPEMKRMTMSSLISMLERHGMVYVKPVSGSMGIGVMKVEKFGKRGIRYQSGKLRKSFPDIESGYASLLRASKGKAYMVQQGIHLAKYRKRPFDIRLMVQRKPRSGWTVTGWVGRLAHPRKIVTNGSQGGTIYPVRVLLPKSGSLIKRMKRVGILCARRLHAQYPGVMQFGLDIAVDHKRRPWILEANTKPDPCPFTKLPSRRMLKRIIRYGAAWGIRYRLHCVKARRGV